LTGFGVLSIRVGKMADSEVLFFEYRDRLFRYLARASGSTDSAQDLTQEVFVRVSRSAVPAVEPARVAAWLFRIARNVVLDHHRRNSRRPAVGGHSSTILRTGNVMYPRKVDSTFTIKPDEVPSIELPRLNENQSGAFASRTLSLRVRSQQIR